MIPSSTVMRKPEGKASPGRIPVPRMIIAASRTFNVWPVESSRRLASALLSSPKVRFLPKGLIFVTTNALQ